MSLKTKNILLFSTLVVCLLVAFWFAFSKTNIGGKRTALNTDSSQNAILNPEDIAKFNEGKRFAFICKPNVELYEKNTLSGKIIASLKPGDSIWNEAEYFCSDTIYNVWFEKDGKLLNGYFKGKNIGYGIQADVDHDGIKEILAVHYTSYNPKDDLQMGRAEMVVIKGPKIINTFQFKAYSNLRVQNADSNNSFPSISFFMINYGEQSCDYPNGEILVSCQNNKLDLVCNHTVATGEVSSLTNDYIFPKDKGGKGNSIIIVESLGYNRENAEGEDTTKMIDKTDSLIYTFSNGKFKEQKR